MKTKTEILFWTLCLVGAVSWLTINQMNINRENKEFILDLESRLQAPIEAEIEEEVETIPKELPQAESASSGHASYYDYTLADGWSSVGHRVCATRDWPRGTMLRVEANGKSTTVKVTDYGPNASVHPDRIIDLSSTAFQDLAPLSSGIIRNVKVNRYEEQT